MKEFTDIKTIIIVVVATIFGGCGVYLYAQAQCYNQYKSYNPTYSIIEGCMVKQNGMSIPSKNLRIIVDKG